MSSDVPVTSGAAGPPVTRPDHPEEQRVHGQDQVGTTPEAPQRPPVAEADLDAVRAQLGRVPRGVVEVAHRCGCGKPDVVRTSPRLPDGTPFPTSYYLTCPRAASLVGTLESGGVMREMSERLEQDEDLAAGHRRAHEDYLARREELGHVEEIAGISAGGMPTRVKCLHVLLAHSLAAGPGTTPLGDEVREQLGEWWRAGSCVAAEQPAAAPGGPAVGGPAPGGPAPGGSAPGGPVPGGSAQDVGDR